MAKSDQDTPKEPAAKPQKRARPSNRDLGIAAGATIATGLAAAALFGWRKGKAPQPSGAEDPVSSETLIERAVGGPSVDQDVVEAAEDDADVPLQGDTLVDQGTDADTTGTVPNLGEPMQYTGDGSPDMAIDYIPGDHSVALENDVAQADADTIPPPLRVDEDAR